MPFVVPGITALTAWPILGTPIGPTALIGFAVAACGLRLARAPHERQLSAQRIAGHADSQITKLYDRRGQKVRLEDMERIRY
jgi:hypothetical protein